MREPFFLRLHISHRSSRLVPSSICACSPREGRDRVIDRSSKRAGGAIGRELSGEKKQGAPDQQPTNDRQAQPTGEKKSEASGRALVFTFTFFFLSFPVSSLPHSENNNVAGRVSRDHHLGPHGRDHHEAPGVDQRVRKEDEEEDEVERGRDGTLSARRFPFESKARLPVPSLAARSFSRPTRWNGSLELCAIRSSEKAVERSERARSCENKDREKRPSIRHTVPVALSTSTSTKQTKQHRLFLSLTRAHTHTRTHTRHSPRSPLPAASPSPSAT